MFMDSKLEKIIFHIQRRMERIIRNEGGVGLANGWVDESDGHGLRALRNDRTLDDLRGDLAELGVSVGYLTPEEPLDPQNPNYDGNWMDVCRRFQNNTS